MLYIDASGLSEEELERKIDSICDDPDTLLVQWPTGHESQIVVILKSEIDSEDELIATIDKLGDSPITVRSLAAGFRRRDPKQTLN